MTNLNQHKFIFAAVVDCLVVLLRPGGLLAFVSRGTCRDHFQKLATWEEF
jgi:hypothetical protein